MNLEIQNEENESKGAYFYKRGTERVAEMTYSIAGTDRIIIDHTEVSDAYRGGELGQKLVRKAVDDARRKGISIVPLCPFARSVFNKNEELRDVL
ncbi:GNAT family N-acetyltransferase [Ekhidna sp.]|uniref:GNAT family N-acetyltransferase n=1 Tax=Ekhidna sp. TaxID=2608089 RepID=UPI0032989A6D